MAHRPLVIAYHLTWTLYGWWLPNDPRGSGSKHVASVRLQDLGPTHLGHKAKLPPYKAVHTFQRKAEQRLYFPRIALTAESYPLVAEALGAVIGEQRYTCWACAIMPDHVHLVIRKHKHTAEEMIEHLQGDSRPVLSRERPWTANHPVWTLNGWKVFLDEPLAVWRSIGYVERNPIEIHQPRQHWPFVQPYDNWPLHEGHSLNSPYAKTLQKAGKYPSNF